MANNITVKDASGSNVVIRTTDVGAGVEANMSIPTNTAGVAADFGPGTGGTTTTPRIIIDSSQLGSLGQAIMASSAPVAIASDQTKIPIQGDVASAATDSGNPIKNGYKATTSLAAVTLVTSAQRTDGYAGVDGVQIVRPHCNLEDIVSGNATNTDGTSTACIAAQAAGIKTYLTSVILCNTSATAITVDIKDGATVKVSLPLPAGSGCIYNPPIPIPGTAATAWNFDGSAAATTVTCSMLGFKSKV